MVKCTTINREDLNNYLEKRGVKEKIWYYWFKYFDKKLNKRTLISLFKKISYEILNKEKKDQNLYIKENRDRKVVLFIGTFKWRNIRMRI